MDFSHALQSEEQRRLAAKLRRVGLVVAPLVAATALLVAPDNMAPRAAALAALLGATLVLWLTEAMPIGVTAVAAPAVGVVAGIADPTTMFAPFAHPTVWLLLGLNLLAYASEWRRLDRVFVMRFFSERRTTLRELTTNIAVASFALSAWMPNRGVVAMMTTVVQGHHQRFGDRFRRLGLSSVAFAALLGGLMLPIGAPANLITLAALVQYDGRELPLLYWTLVAVPLAVMLMAGWLLVIRRVHGVDGETIVHGDVRMAERWVEGRRRRPPTTQMLRVPDNPLLALELDRAQLSVAVVIVAMLVLFAVPGLARLVLDPTTATRVAAFLPPMPIALLASALLYVLPAAQPDAGHATPEPVAEWGATSHVDWQVLLVVGSGLALGQQTMDTGLSQWLGDLVVRGSGVHSELGLTFLLTAFTLCVTQIASSAVTSAICAPLAIVTAQQVAVSPVAPCLAVGLAASFGVLLPMSDECNQFIYSTGAFRREQLLQRGAVATVAALLLIPPVVVVAARILAV